LLRPFFVGPHIVEHVLGVIELLRLLGGGRRGPVIAAARQAQENASCYSFHAG
jgi:hypothetical protein